MMSCYVGYLGFASLQVAKLMRCDAMIIRDYDLLASLSVFPSAGGVSSTHLPHGQKEDDGIGASIVPVLPPPPPRGGGLLGPALNRMDEN